jgi:hypothetical protein
MRERQVKHMEKNYRKVRSRPRSASYTVDLVSSV